MPTDFLPKREAELVTFSNGFNAHISADPTAYGLDPAQAAAYAALQGAFVSAYQTANDPGTRTPASIVAKNNARDALIESTRELAAIIRAFPSLTDSERAALGLSARDGEPTPVGPPQQAPGIRIVAAVGRAVHIQLLDRASLTPRGKPASVDGATVFSFIGTRPPAPEDLKAWTFEGNLSRTMMKVEFPSSVPSGATAWFTAFWFNPRKQAGPMSMPVSAQIPGSLPQAA